MSDPHEDGECPPPDQAEVLWLVSYSDFMMQLVILFLLLYATSNPDPGRLQQIAQSFREHFGDKPVVSVIDTRGDYHALMKPRPVAPGTKQPFGDDPRGKRIQLTYTEQGVWIQFADTVMFPLGSHELTPDARELLELVRRELTPYLNDIEIIGHTSVDPTDSLGGDHWTLSLLRAKAGAGVLIGDENAPGIHPNRVIVTGRSLYDPRSKDDPAKNRRIEILVRPLAQTKPK